MASAAKLFILVQEKNIALPINPARKLSSGIREYLENFTDADGDASWTHDVIIEVPQWMDIPYWAFSYVSDWLINNMHFALSTTDIEHHFVLLLLVFSIIDPYSRHESNSSPVSQESVIRIWQTHRAADYLGIDKLADDLSKLLDHFKHECATGSIMSWEEITNAGKDLDVLTGKTPLLSRRSRKQICLVSSQDTFLIRHY